MNTRAFTLALIISFIAMFMVYSYIESREAEINKQYGSKTTVVVAKVDIQELELIDDSKITIKKIPTEFLAPKHFKKIEELNNTVATVPILKGEQITQPRVTYPGLRTGLSRQVSLGKRAVAVKIDDSSGVSKLIKPGDRVDVLAGINYGGGRKDLSRVSTILQDVLVLSTGFNISNSIPLVGVKTATEVRAMKLATYNSYAAVTIELTPYEVQRLIWFKNFMGGEITLSLRNNNDKNKINIKSTKIFDLIDDETSQEAKSYFMEKFKKGRK